MKFLVDAQLPRRLARELILARHDAVHTLDLSLRNRTPDDDICLLAASEGRVVVSKDSDFVTSFWLHHQPPKLLLVSTGNIDNDALIRLINLNLEALVVAFEKHDFIEISASAMTIHT